MTDHSVDLIINTETPVSCGSFKTRFAEKDTPPPPPAAAERSCREASYF